jgi:hypothetical protein
MRKSFAFVVAALLLSVAVAACGSQSTASTPSPAANTPAVEQSTGATTTATPESTEAATVAAQVSSAAAVTPTQATQQPATAAATQAAPPASTPTTAATVAVTPVVGGPQPGARTVTLADDGKTISLAPGETFLLALGDGQWSPEIDNQAVVSRVINIAVVRGAQGVYMAHIPGTAHLTATSGSVTFRLTIVVM